MAKLNVMPKESVDTHIGDSLDPFARRVLTTPPGICPIAVQYSMLVSSGVQTCGKCVPCRDGIPYLAQLLKQVLDCTATEQTLEQIKELAASIRDTSDCAIGYHAGELVLQGLEDFADEYDSHIKLQMCTADISQKVPCEALCPAHVNVPGYIALVGEGDYAGAINMVRKDNPFVTMCALVCEHPCELRCRRALIDAPINIRGIKKFAVDQIPADQVPVPKRAADTGKRIAVIGGGPSGLTCAYYSALMGHKVTVFEMRSKLGGMTRYGIPAYRFPRERLDEDIRAVLSVGNIEVKLNTKISVEDEEALENEYDAVYFAVGAQLGKTLRMENSDAEGVMSAVDLLSMIGDENYPDYTGKKVAIIGGGNVAMDCCRTAVRAGAEQVTCVYRRRIEDMTALKQEIESAMQEGVEMMTLAAPDRIEVDENGHCCALIIQPQYISAVRRGRPAPAKADKPEVRLEADIILIAVGQDIMSISNGVHESRGTYEADTNLKYLGPKRNVFVGGDCQTGPATVIRAIGAGKVAARNIDEFLGYHHKIACDVEAPPAKPNNRTAYGRVEVLERPARERKHDFEYVEEDISLEEAIQESGRCLRCDHYGCGIMEGGRIQYV